MENNYSTSNEVDAPLQNEEEHQVASTTKTSSHTRFRPPSRDPTIERVSKTDMLANLTARQQYYSNTNPQ